MSSTLESYELIRFAEAFEARLATAGEMFAGRPGLEAEKRWLADALELVRTTRAPSAAVVDRVKDLPELEEAREEYAFHQLGLWVDALEKLHAGITFTASSRAPVIEALFPHVKFPQLRRAPRDAIIEYATSYERRTKSSYVTRIFARDDFALVRPVMEQVTTAFAAWRSSHEPAPLTPEVEIVLREELVALGRKLDVALRQARLLSEAATVAVPSVYEAAGLNLKPKRRAGRGLGPTADEGLAGYGEEPVDSMEPTEAELAEVAALDAGGDEEELTPGAVEGAGASAGDAGGEVFAAGGAAAHTEAAGGEGDAHDAAGLASPDEGAMHDAAGPESPGPVAEEGARPGTGAARASPESGAKTDSDNSARGAKLNEASTSEGASEAPVAGEQAPETGGPRAARGESPAPAPSDSEPSTEPRGARKGRKKAEAAPSPSEAEAPPASAEAQAPRVRKKKAPAPDAPGSDTP